MEQENLMSLMELISCGMLIGTVWLALLILREEIPRRMRARCNKGEQQ
jgi:hypothetical protein